MKPIDSCQLHRTRYYIVADDLTGACDSAVAFTGRGMVVEVPLCREDNPRWEGVCAINTESRHIAEETSQQRVRDALNDAQADQEVFKKIDSVFRGNTFSEICVALESFPCELVVMSPAYPGLGRTVQDGVLQVQDGIQKRHLDLCEGLRSAGIGDAVRLAAGGSQEELRAEMRKVARMAQPVVLCDATRDEDLRAVVSAARSLKGRILWIGSGGLAHALAHELPLNPEEEIAQDRSGRVLLFVGSEHVVTARQVAALKDNGGVTEIAVEDFERSSLEAQTLILKVSMGSTTEEQIRKAIEIVGNEGIRSCVLTGGDTAAFVLRALGTRSLRLRDEFAPGLPRGIAQGGVLDGLSVILKSGGFGHEDVFCRIAERFAVGRESV